MIFSYNRKALTKLAGEQDDKYNLDTSCDSVARLQTQRLVSLEITTTFKCGEEASFSPGHTARLHFPVSLYMKPM